MSTASRSPASPAASAHEQLLDEPSVYTIINTNSPLKLDVPMMEGIIQMSGSRPGRDRHAVHAVGRDGAGHRSPARWCSRTPRRWPASPSRRWCRKGAPVGYGGFTSNVDMKSGAPAFGTPEYMKAQLVGGQLARRYNLPYRTSNTCAANTVDAQAAYESVFSLWGAITGGGNFIMHGAGWLEGGLRCSYEKIILDIDLLQMVAEFLTPLDLSRRRARRRRDPRGRPGRPLLRHAAHAGALQDGLLFADPLRLAQFRDLGRGRQSPTALETRQPIWKERLADLRGAATWTRRSARSSTPSSTSARPKAARRRIFDVLAMLELSVGTEAHGEQMKRPRRSHAPDAPPAGGGYAQADGSLRRNPHRLRERPDSGHGRRHGARELRGPRRGLPGPMSSRNLRAADMTLDNLVKVTIFLSDRKYIADYRRIRDEALGGRRDRADHDHHRHLRREMAARDRGYRRA